MGLLEHLLNFLLPFFRLLRVRGHFVVTLGITDNLEMPHKNKWFLRQPRKRAGKY